MRLPPASRLLVAWLSLLAACASGAEGSRSLALETLNASGVSGTVMLEAVDTETTRVVVEVEEAGHPNMPAHIHPGTCDDLTPQPKYPLENVVDGRSVTVVPASLEELVTDGVALNLHASNEDMQTYTACVELR